MITTPTLVDTGPLVALLSSTQQHHRECVAAFGELARPLFTCWPVLTETAYLLRHRQDLVASLLESADGRFLRILPLEERDLPGINAILSKYGDQKLDLADACLMYLAEREGVRSVLTLDTEFRLFRTTGGEHLALVPIAGVHI